MATKKSGKPKAGTGIRNTLSSRTTNRTRVRAQSAVVIPLTGALKGILEARVAERIRAFKRKGNLFRYPIDPLLLDTEEMLSNGVADLKRFRDEDMPVTQRHLDMLELHLDELAIVGVERRTAKVKRENVGEDAEAAMYLVLDCRQAFAKRGAANDIPLSTFDVRKATGSPRALYRAVAEVLNVTKPHLSSFDSPRRAKELWEALDAANATLGEVSQARIELKGSDSANTARKHALLNSLYDLMLWLSRWGDAMAGGDALAQKRWRLDNMFPGQSKLKDADHLVPNAVTEPNSTPSDADPG